MSSGLKTAKRANWLELFFDLVFVFAIGFSISGELNTTDHIIMIGIGLAMFIGSMAFIYGVKAMVTGAQRISFIILVTASGLMLANGLLQP